MTEAVISSLVLQKQYTLLMCSARNNRLSVVHFLLDCLENIEVDSVDCEQQTALHHAAFAGHKEVVARLIQVGASTKAVNKVSKRLAQPLCKRKEFITSVCPFHF